MNNVESYMYMYMYIYMECVTKSIEYSALQEKIWQNPILMGRWPGFWKNLPNFLSDLNVLSQLGTSVPKMENV